LPNSDAVLVNGDSGAKYVARLGASEKTIFRVPQTTEASLFSPLPLSKSEEQAHRLLYVGQLVERKGLFPFLSMLSRWAENHAEASVQFWLVGDGPERKRLETLIIPENVKLHFWGDVAHEELGQFYAQAGILVLPTLADEWGIVVNEAMTAGLPILGSKYSQAVEELVLDNVTGWTFRPDQSNAVYAAIDRALSTSIERLEEMRVAARRRTEKLSPGFVAHRILEAVRFVCSTVGNSIESHPCPRKPRRADD
jgi:glycosyltransferase involved in cell wall biosynthesis